MNKNCCRTCLSEKELISIHLKQELDGGTKTIAEIIENISQSVKISENDVLPQLICAVCKNEILRSFSLKTQIEETDSYLKNLLLSGTDSKKQNNGNELEAQKIDLEPKQEVEDEEDDFQENDAFDDDVEVKLEDEENNSPVKIRRKSAKKTKRESSSKKSSSLPPSTDLFQCIECPLKFLSDKALVRHKKNYHCKEEEAENLYKCFTCDRSFKNNDSLKKHESEKVLGLCKKLPGTVNRKCYLCHQEYESISLKLKHLETDHQDIDKKCTHCGFECKSIRSFDRHLRYHLLGFDFFCAECGKNFKSRAALKEHNTVRHTEDFQKWICDQCGISFKFREHILRHMKEIHLKLKRFKCEYCPGEVRFIRQVALSQHWISHHNFKTPFKCAECDNHGFVFKSQLEYHILQKHRGGKQYRTKKAVPRISLFCDICKKELKTSYGYKRHMMIHNNIKPYSCEVCQKSFGQKTILDIHKRIHTGEKPFSCTECSRSFADPSTLYKHTSSAHPYLLIYQCNDCDKKFASEKTLDNHKARIHPQ